MHIVVLAGMPASGKTTFSKKLSEALGLPVLSKDRIKEVLFDTIGFKCYAEKRQLDHAANALTLSYAETLIENGMSVIIDNNFDKPAAQALDELIKKYRCGCVTVFFDGETEAFYRRYTARDNAHQRHLGHILQERYPPAPGDPLDYEMTYDEFVEKFVKRGMREFRVAGERLDVDATVLENVDAEALTARIKALIRQQGNTVFDAEEKP